MSKYNPSELAEITERIDTAWAELFKLTSMFSGFGYLDNSGELPAGYYLYALKDEDKDNNLAHYTMLYAESGANLAKALEEYVKITQHIIEEAGDTCRAMMCAEVTRAIVEDDAKARERVEQIYMPALGLKDYRQAQMMTLVDKVTSLSGVPGIVSALENLLG